MKIEQGRAISRRGLLFPLANAPQERELADYRKLPEQKVGNMQLTVVTTGHTSFHWERNGAELAELMHSHNAVIFEYFPPEWKKIDADWKFKWMLDHYKENNELFYQLEKVAYDQGKQVWVTDPAYCVEFAAVRAIRAGAPLSVGAGLMYAFLNGIGLSRRVTIGATSVATIASGVSFAAVHDPTYPLEDDVRNVISAELTLKLSQHVTPGLKVLKVTTEGHWKEEKGLMKDNVDRRLRLEALRPLLALPYMSKLAVARRYIPQDDQWKKIEELSI